MDGGYLSGKDPPGRVVKCSCKSPQFEPRCVYADLQHSLSPKCVAKVQRCMPRVGGRWHPSLVDRPVISSVSGPRTFLVPVIGDIWSVIVGT